MTFLESSIFESFNPPQSTPEDLLWASVQEQMVFYSPASGYCHNSTLYHPEGPAKQSENPDSDAVGGGPSVIQGSALTPSVVMTFTFLGAPVPVYHLHGTSYPSLPVLPIPAGPSHWRSPFSPNKAMFFLHVFTYALSVWNAVFPVKAHQPSLGPYLPSSYCDEPTRVSFLKKVLAEPGQSSLC